MPKGRSPGLTYPGERPEACPGTSLADPLKGRRQWWLAAGLGAGLAAAWSIAPNELVFLPYGAICNGNLTADTLQC